MIGLSGLWWKPVEVRYSSRAQRIVSVERNRFTGEYRIDEHHAITEET